VRRGRLTDSFWQAQRPRWPCSADWIPGDAVYRGFILSPLIANWRSAVGIRKHFRLHLYCAQCFAARSKKPGQKIFHSPY
jgi:hypothetical protein